MRGKVVIPKDIRVRILKNVNHHFKSDLKVLMREFTEVLKSHELTSKEKRELRKGFFEGAVHFASEYGGYYRDLGHLKGSSLYNVLYIGSVELEAIAKHYINPDGVTEEKVVYFLGEVLMIVVLLAKYAFTHKQFVRMYPGNDNAFKRFHKSLRIALSEFKAKGYAVSGRHIILLLEAVLAESKSSLEDVQRTEILNIIAIFKEA